jgi:hypothetical protein
VPRKSFRLPFWACVLWVRQLWSRAGVSNAFTARSHKAYCGLVRGPHVEKLQYVVYLTAQIIVNVYSIFTMYKCVQRPYNTTWRAAGWRPMDETICFRIWPQNGTTTPNNLNSPLCLNLNNYFSYVSSDISITVEPSRIWYGGHLTYKHLHPQLDVSSFLRGTLACMFSWVPCSCGLMSFSSSHFWLRGR